MRSSFPVRGGIYLVSDAALTLPPEDDRKVHATRRPVVVLSRADKNEDPDWPVVLVAPLSSETGRRTELCVKINAGEGGSSKRTWVRVPAVQPLAKALLEDRTGVLPPQRLREVQANLLHYLGILDRKPGN